MRWHRQLGGIGSAALLPFKAVRQVLRSAIFGVGFMLRSDAVSPGPNTVLGTAILSDQTVRVINRLPGVPLSARHEHSGPTVLRLDRVTRRDGSRHHVGALIPAWSPRSP